MIVYAGFYEDFLNIKTVLKVNSNSPLSFFQHSDYTMNKTAIGLGDQQLIHSEVLGPFIA